MAFGVVVSLAVGSGLLALLFYGGRRGIQFDEVNEDVLFVYAGDSDRDGFAIPSAAPTDQRQIRKIALAAPGRSPRRS
jgi:hypothetical protein